MHIVFVESGYPHSHGGGGAGTYVQLYGHYLVQKGHRVTVVAEHCKQCPNVYNDEGVQVFRPKIRTPCQYYLSKLPVVGQIAVTTKTVERGFHLYRFIEQLHRDNPIDLVEFAEGGDFWHAWKRPFSIVVHLHGSRYTFLKQFKKKMNRADWWQRRLELMFIQRADYIVSPSKALLDIVNREADQLRPPVTVMPYPLDPKLQYQSFNNDQNRPLRVLFAARNDPVKGANILLDAVPFVTQEVPTVEFHFFGFKPRTNQTVPQNVTIHSFVPKAELLAWYCHADVCVIPSIWDNSPNTVYEAMAAGKAVIASNVGGISELVEHGKTGLLIAPNNTGDLVDALVTLLLSKELRQKYGEAGRLRIQKLADIEQNSTTRLNLYGQIIN